MDIKEFSDYVADITAAGYTCTLLALGHELRLFELMMKENKPMTSHEIADKARMKERFVREWLAGVVTGKLVTLDPASQTYYVPETHHATLRTQSAWACGVMAIGAGKEAVKRCFMKDGPNGLSFDNDDSYWSWFGDWRRLTSEPYVKNDIVPRLRETDVTGKLNSGTTVLDVCCGAGDITFVLAALFPNSTFTGVDISEKALQLANETAISSKVENAHFSIADVERLSKETTSSYDMVTMFDAIHELPNPDKALKELDKVLNPDGVFICTEMPAASRLQDDVGKLRIASSYAVILNHCLPSKLNINPNAERETSWGRDDLKQAVDAVFQITHTFELQNHVLMMVCKKRSSIPNLDGTK